MTQGVPDTDTNRVPEGRALRVRLILDRPNSQWIIGKFAQRLFENLARWNVVADIGETPSADVDINHWMIYHYPWLFYHPGRGPRLGKSTMAITHVDDPIKFNMLKWALEEVVDVGICMSRMTVDDLVRRGVPRRDLTYVTPAHDNAVSPRRIVIGITTRVYPDGRKREDLLLTAARKMRFDAFHFEIMGKGWDNMIPHLEAAGATVAYHRETESYQQDYVAMIERIPKFDYYLYMGLDEGSMGILDALAAGVGTIVTPQGFHLDVEGGITHSFWSADDLRAAFERIAGERQQRIDSVKHLTWLEYARRHALLWRTLIDEGKDSISSLSPADVAHATRRRTRFQVLVADLKYYSKIRNSSFLREFVRRWQTRVRRPLSRVKQQMIRLYRNFQGGRCQR